MRRQAGTGDLRAIRSWTKCSASPPTASPPSKPLLTLLKASPATASASCCAPRTPSTWTTGAINAGTWLIGRLRRSAACCASSTDAPGREHRRRRCVRPRQDADVDRGPASAASSHDVHEDGPVVLESRWVMSYLRALASADRKADGAAQSGGASRRRPPQPPPRATRGASASSRRAGRSCRRRATGALVYRRRSSERARISST